MNSYFILILFCIVAAGIIGCATSLKKKEKLSPLLFVVCQVIGWVFIVVGIIVSESAFDGKHILLGLVSSCLFAVSSYLNVRGRKNAIYIISLCLTLATLCYLFYSAETTYGLSSPSSPENVVTNTEELETEETTTEVVTEPAEPPMVSYDDLYSGDYNETRVKVTAMLDEIVYEEDVDRINYSLWIPDDDGEYHLMTGRLFLCDNETLREPFMSAQSGDFFILELDKPQYGLSRGNKILSMEKIEPLDTMENVKQGYVPPTTMTPEEREQASKEGDIRFAVRNAFSTEEYTISYDWDNQIVSIVVEYETILSVEWTTDFMINSMREVLEELSDDNSYEVQFDIYFPFVDAYGNETRESVLDASFSPQTREKINWENFSNSNLPVIADTFNAQADLYQYIWD